MALTWAERFQLIKLLRVDVYLCLFFISFSICNVSFNQLVEDKICLNELQLNSSVCLDLEHVGSNYEKDKNYVISFSSNFKNYQTALVTSPGIIFSLFVGHWIDNYPKHLKYILAAPAFGGFISAIIIIYNCFNFTMDPYYLLYSDALKGLCGGFATVFTGTYTYITRRTPASYRAIRFAVLEFFSFIATPISVYLGGYILTMKPFFPSQPRNYIGVFMVSGITSALAFFWILIFLNDADSGNINEPGDDINDSKLTSDSVDTSTIGNNQSSSSLSLSDEPELEIKKERKASFSTTVLDIFNISNVISMIKTCTKPRENACRARIWHSFFITVIVLMCYMGEVTIGFAFAQKVYKWNAEYYSNISSILMIIPSLGTTFISPILIKKFNFTDTALGIFGCLSLMSGMIIKGSWLSPAGFFFSTVFGAFGGLMPVAIRSFLSRMIHYDEIGQVYSFLACIESSAPPLSSLFYSQLFAATINSYPGIVYQISAFALLYPLFVTLWLDLTRLSWYEIYSKDSIHNEHSQEARDSSFQGDLSENESIINPTTEDPAIQINDKDPLV